MRSGVRARMAAWCEGAAVAGRRRRRRPVPPPHSVRGTARCRLVAEVTSPRLPLRVVWGGRPRVEARTGHARRAWHGARRARISPFTLSARAAACGARAAGVLLRVRQRCTRPVRCRSLHEVRERPMCAYSAALALAYRRSVSRLARPMSATRPSQCPLTTGSRDGARQVPCADGLGLGVLNTIATHRRAGAPPLVYRCRRTGRARRAADIATPRRRRCCGRGPWLIHRSSPADGGRAWRRPL